MPQSTILPLTLTPDSSQLHGYAYDAGTQTLALEFNSNHAQKTYHYPGFTPEQFEAFKNAESQGSYFYANIKKQWPDGKFVTMYKDAPTEHDPLES
jgi:hypothetical protein